MLPVALTWSFLSVVPTRTSPKRMPSSLPLTEHCNCKGTVKSLSVGANGCEMSFSWVVPFNMGV